jgi:4-hydroxy-tetrahydrodipicolinate reductase
MSAPVRIAVLGAAGKMGRALVRVLGDEPGGKLVCAVERPGAREMGQDAGVLAGVAAAAVVLGEELPAANQADVWVDFSAAAAAAGHAQAAADAGAALVLGTTGLPAPDRVRITELSRRVPVVLSPNMSVGVNVLLRLVAEAARSLGPGYDIEILETHHRQKRDAPSGTALRLAESLAEATGRNLAETGRYARHGDIGARPGSEIGLQTLRGGDVIGDHTVFFLGLGERIEITHRASSRETFARGAVRAALWLAGRQPGLYDMRDVLGMV